MLMYYRRYDNSAFEDAIVNVLDRAREIDFKRAREKAIEYALEAAIVKAGMGKGEVLTDEQARQFARDVAEGLKPFIMHNMTPIGRFHGIYRKDKD